MLVLSKAGERPVRACSSASGDGGEQRVKKYDVLFISKAKHCTQWQIAVV